MAIPWLRVLDAALTVTDLARGLQRRRPGALAESAATGLATPSAPLEARFAGVVVAALKEAFDRDSQRVQAEREQREAEQRRAERLLKLEWLRQAGERELARLRLLAGLTVASWLGTVVFAALATSSVAARVTLGVGWTLLLAALAAGLSAQARVADALGRLVDQRELAKTATVDVPSGGDVGAAAAWLLVAGLAVSALAVLIR